MAHLCHTTEGGTDTLTPMDPELDRQFQALFDAHDEAFRALRVANTEMGTANAAMAHGIQAHDEVIQAHQEAIKAALETNRAALTLLERLSGNGHQG